MISIRKLLFPSIIYGRRIISERFLGIHIGETFIKGTVTKLSGSKKIIEKLIEIDLQDKTILDFDGTIDQTLLWQGLEKVYKQAGSVDKIIVSLPANMFIFKEMEMPFSEQEKIKMVLAYEAEPLLPFSIDASAIDFIKAPGIVSGPCKIMICATENNILSGVATALNKAKIKPDNLVVDMVTLADLCQQAENRSVADPNYVIISLSEKWTKIGFVDQGLLRFVKNIQFGSNDIIFKVSQLSEIDYEQAKAMIQTESEHQEIETQQNIYKSIDSTLSELVKKIKFSIQSFNSKAENPLGLEKIIFFEEKISIPGLLTLCQQKLGLPCQKFSVEKLVNQKNIENRACYKPSSIYWNLSSTANSMISPELESFNLGQKVFSSPTKEIFKYQAIASFIIIASIALYISLAGSLRSRSLSESISNIERSIQKKISTNLVAKGNVLPKRVNQKKLIENAYKYFDELDNSWKIHGDQDLKPLEILLDLTRLLDKNKFDVEVEEFKIFYEESKKVLNLNGNFKTDTGKDDFKNLISTLSKWKKISNLKVKEEQAPDQIKFSIETTLEI